jgi:hypothetical protein
MRLALKAWHVLPCGLVLVALAGIAAAGFAPKPLTATAPMSLEVGDFAAVAPQSAILRMPVSGEMVYEESGREDPFAKTDRLMNALLRELGRTK